MTNSGPVDSHCHLDLTAAEHDLDTADLLAESRRQGISHLIHISTNLESFLTLAPFAGAHPDLLSLTLGLMPGESPDALDHKVMEIVEKKQICAIGEIGLDYYRYPDSRQQQMELFSQQCELAMVHDLPVVIHNRDADEDLLAVLSRFPGLRGVLHCFTGEADMALALVEMGFYLSFSGILTFSNAEGIQAAAEVLPTGRILVETDAPYLSPVPVRGRRNLPWYISHTIRFLAEIRGESAEIVTAYTAENARALFGF